MAPQVLAAQAAGFGPHQALQITGVTQTPELNGLLCQMEDLRGHQAPQAHYSTLVYTDTRSRTTLPAAFPVHPPISPPSHLSTSQGHRSKPGRVLVRITKNAAATAAGNRGGMLVEL